MRIILKHISLLNFKGVRKLEIDFNDSLTTISGKNGLGKSTIFDAFTWLLFGKDSHGNTQFNIKTLDSNGQVIQRIPHEVSAILLVDGQETLLRRTYNEKWVKRRGAAEETFQDHESEYFFNDVPMNKGEYQKRINDICDEEVFKMVTSPTHFTSLPWEKQRTILFSIAGDVSNEELVGDNKDFADLLDNLTGKSLEDFKKEIGAKKKKIKNEIDTIPARIDECNRSMPVLEDWTALEEQITNGKKRISEIDNILTDISASQNDAADKRRKILDEQSAIYNKRMDLMRRMKDEANKDYFAAAAERQKLNQQYYELEDEVKRAERKITELTDRQAKCQELRETLVAQYREIIARELVFDEDNFKCPTCHRSFEPEQIETMQISMRSEFNERKANDLKANTEKGLANKKVMEDTATEIESLKTKIAELTEKMKVLKEDKVFKENTTTPDITEQIEQNEDYKALLKQEQDLQVEIDKPLANSEDETTKKSLKQERNDLLAHEDQLKSLLSRRERIADAKKRIAELEEQLQTQSQALADLEKTEFTIEQFSKARIDKLTEKVDSMFSLVKFKLFKEQLNGGVRECCEATVDGVPLMDTNSANKILAGIDIIDTISKHYGVSAPVIFDNAERVDHDIALPDCQTICLRVTQDKELTITK